MDHSVQFGLTIHRIAPCFQLCLLRNIRNVRCPNSFTTPNRCIQTEEQPAIRTLVLRPDVTTSRLKTIRLKTFIHVFAELARNVVVTVGTLHREPAFADPKP